MNRGFVAALLALAPLAGCAAVHSYALPLSGAEARAYFDPIAVCASQRNLDNVKHPNSVNVRAVPGAWVQYMVQNGGLNMVIVVDDGSGGPETVRHRSLAAKRRGDEIFACAQAAGPQPIAPVAQAQPPAPPAEPPPAPPAPPHGHGGKDPFAGMMQAMGKGFGAMAACTKLTTCRTRLSGELCLGTDKACLDAINSGDRGGPDGCAHNLERVRAAAEKYKRRIPNYELPAECK
jgi:hypothetical protein